MIQDALNGAMSKWKNYAVRDGFGAMNPPLRVHNGASSSRRAVEWDGGYNLMVRTVKL